MFNIKKDVLFSCMALLVYYGIMEFYYVDFIVPNYEKYGFHASLNLFKYIESKFLFLLVVAISIMVSRVSGFVYSIYIFFIVFFFVPISITYSLSNQEALPMYATSIILLGLAFTSGIHIKAPTLGKRLSPGIILLIILFAVIPFGFQFGLYINPGNLLLVDIDETRKFFDTNTKPLFDYFYNWLVKAVLPLCLVYFTIRKKYYQACITLILALYLYTISGNKIVYITIFVTLFFSFFGQDYFQKIRYFLYVLIIGLIVIPLVDYAVLDSNGLKGVFVMRMFFLPAELNYLYLDYFRDHYIYYSSSTFFNLFTEYPFDKPIGYIISENYFGEPGMNANNGIIGDGFMNMGYLGVAINIILVVLVMMVFNSLRPDPRYLGIFFVMVFLFLSVPMLSMFITSGIIVIAFMFITVLKNKHVIKI